MRKRRALAMPVILLLAALAARPQEEAVFSTEARLVVLHATVADKSGHLLTDLPRSAFHVFENGAEQQIKVFHREDIPVSMGIVIDNSASMNDKRQKVESAALGLVRASNPQDEVMIVSFNYDPVLDVEFTSDIAKMEKGIARTDSRGATAMRDAIKMSLDYMREHASRDKKVLFVVTDGNDNLSQTTLDEVVREAQRAEALVYAIGLLSEEDKKEARQAHRALDAITVATGGQAFYPKELGEVGPLAQRIAHDIRNQYTVAYSPSNQALDRTFRKIQVVANAPGRPVVRTRSGYYATPESAKPAPAAPSR